MGQREILAKEYLQWIADREVTPEAIARRYAQTPELHRPQLRIRHLRLGAEADADALRARLARGVPFPELAREVSADPATGPRGGDLGWLDAPVVADSFGEAVARGEAGQVIGPLSALGAVHLVWIEARRDAIPLAEVEAGLREELQAEVRERVTSEATRALRIERP